MKPTILTQPQDNEAERITVGALMIDPDAIARVAAILTPEDFHDPVYATIYSSIQEMHEAQTPIDFVTVADAVRDEQHVTASGGSAFLAQLASDVPTASHVDAYAGIIRDQSLKRRAATLGRAIAEHALSPDATAESVVEVAEQGILQLSRGATDATTTFDLASLREERFEHYVEVYEAEDKASFYGLTTGFAGLDTLLTGLPASNLVVVAARPSMGKTAFALDVARHAVDHLGKKVMFISLEMSKEEVADRILAGALSVSTHDLRKGLIDEKQFATMGKAFDDIRPDRFFIDDDCDCSLPHLRSKARQQQIKHGLDLLIVDYLHR